MMQHELHLFSGVLVYHRQKDILLLSPCDDSLGLLQVFGSLLNMLVCSSEREAQNLAITMEILLADVTRWQVGLAGH